MNNFITNIIDETFNDEIIKSDKGYCPLSLLENSEKYKKEDSFRGQISRLNLEIHKSFAIKLCSK